MTMKKRILFVDDEEFALRGLDRLLRSMREEWEMEFLDSGDKALARMAGIAEPRPGRYPATRRNACQRARPASR